MDKGKIYSRILPFLILLVCQNQVIAGAWVQRKHGYYFKLSGNYLLATKEFNHEGERLDIFQERIIYKDASFRDFNITAYLEYGLFERLTLIANFPFKILTSKRTEIIAGGLLARKATIHSVGFADLILSSRFALLREPFVLSLQSGIKTPLFYDEKPGDDGPPLGTGKIDLESHLLLGKSLYPLPIYITASIGYRWRSGPLHDQILYTAEAGYTLDKILFKVTIEGLQSTIQPPDIIGQPVTTPLPGGGGALPNIIEGDQDVFKISPSMIFNLTNGIGLQGEILHIYGGKNTVAGTIYSFALVLTR
jgi:hypothetical protein